MEITRREALAAMAAAGSAALIGTGGSVLAAAENKKGAPAPDGLRVATGQHEPKILPFDPAKLNGISEKLIISHHDNNYAGAVKNLNKVEKDLFALTPDVEPFKVSGLKERELTFTNSMILHEHYFGNLGGNGQATGDIKQALTLTYGAFSRWEELFKATGMSLAGGSGWVVLVMNFQTGDLRTYWSGNHTQAVAFGQPLLVMDMYEHAYQMDYGAAAAKYIDAFFANIRWEEVNRRFAQAMRALPA